MRLRLLSTFSLLLCFVISTASLSGEVLLGEKETNHDEVHISLKLKEKIKKMERLLLKDQPLKEEERQQNEKVLSPPLEEIYRFLGYIAWKREDYLQTISEFQEVLKRKPADLEALYFLALCNQKLDNVYESIRLLKEIVNLDKENVRVKKELAFIFSKNGGFSESIALYREILSDNPGNNVAAQSLISILVTQKRYSEAIAFLKGQILREAENSQWIHQLAQVYSWAGNYEASIKIYKKLLQEDVLLLNKSDLFLDSSY